MSAAAGKTYNFAFSENDMVGYYDHNGAMVRDDVDRSIFRIAGFENISWPRGGSGSTVTWTKVRLSCAIYSFDPSRGSYRQDHPLTSQIKFTDKLLCGDGSSSCSRSCTGASTARSRRPPTSEAACARCPR